MGEVVLGTGVDLLFLRKRNGHKALYEFLDRAR
jgi:hypothetical protein